jgi:glycosyltransferase involved in cell wall biosynthesis
MASPPEAEELLSAARQRVLDLQRRPGIGRIPAGLPQIDWRLWRLGRSLIAATDGDAGQGNATTPRPDVFLATELYGDGGHTALIGDFVAALAEAPGAAPAHLVLTQSSHRAATLPEPIRIRTGIARENLHGIEGPSLRERFDQLLALMIGLRPGRLFLFHHPEDPLASVIAQPAIAPGRYLVHHADASPSLGLHVPGMRVIELNPFAAAAARTRRMPADLLLLTVRDPGPRPHGFRALDRLVTATCGNQHKYEAEEHAYRYPEVVAAVVKATGGRHIHIGTLSERTLVAIAMALRGAGVAMERFVHVPWVPSLAAALWEHRCDVYLASFPMDGARAFVEVAASATPYVAHGGFRVPGAASWTIGPRPTAVWNTVEDLAAILARFQDAGVLEEASRRIRAFYEECHHPDVFRRTLGLILSGGGGIVDPDAAARDRFSMRTLMLSVSEALAAGGVPAEARPAGVGERPEEQPGVAVVVMLRDGAGAPRRSLDSVLTQTIVPHEIIVVDEATKGDGPAAVEEIGTVLPVTLVAAAGRGTAAARNLAIAQCTSPLIAFIDQGDEWYPTHLAELAAPFGRRSGPPVGWTYSDVDRLDGDGRLVVRNLLAQLPATHPKKSLADCLHHDLLVLPSAAMLARAAIAAVGGFDERLTAYAEDDLLLRLFLAGYDNVFVRRPLAKCRMDGRPGFLGGRSGSARIDYARRLLERFPDEPQRGEYWATDVLLPRFLAQIGRDFILASRSRDDRAAMQALIGEMRSLLPYLGRRPQRRAGVSLKLASHACRAGRLSLARRFVRIAMDALKAERAPA